MNVDAKIAKAWAARAEVVTHELVQPLNAILLMTEVLARSALADEQRGWLERVRAATIRLSHLVGDLADTSQLETGRLPLDLQRVDLCEVLRRSVASVPEALPRTALHLPSRTVVARVDPRRLEQVLANLLKHAVERGAANDEIVVELERVDDHAVLAVSNQGAPVADRFGPHAALGPYVAKLLVEAHGGTIWSESHGETTTVIFTIPVCRA